MRDPRREEYTICTAVAPEAVFTVRTYATSAPYEPRLVHLAVVTGQVGLPQLDLRQLAGRLRGSESSPGLTRLFSVTMYRGSQYH